MKEWISITEVLRTVTDNNECYMTLLLTNQGLFLNDISIKHSFMAAKEYDYMLKSNLKIGTSMLKYKMSDLFYFYFVFSIWFFNLPWVDK